MCDLTCFVTFVHLRFAARVAYFGRVRRLPLARAHAAQTRAYIACVVAGDDMTWWCWVGVVAAAAAWCGHCRTQKGHSHALPLRTFCPAVCFVVMPRAW